jgi:antitoxin (DNA-binding transcriptional repressor) of toxin-antitoxin stability system
MRTLVSMAEQEPQEVGLREARATLTHIARKAADLGQTTYLTSNGFRVAAIVPISDAGATRTCGARHGNWRCNIQAEHDGRHTTAFDGRILDCWDQE